MNNVKTIRVAVVGEGGDSYIKTECFKGAWA